MAKYNLRKTKGKEIAGKPDQIKRIYSNHYQVKSQSSEQWYDLIYTELGINCSCPDYTFRKVCCKHIHALEISLKIKKEVENEVIIKPFSNLNCLICNSSNIVKRGKRKNIAGNIQRYYCNNCGKWFVFNLGFKGMRATPQIITSAMQLYFTGESLRNVTKFLKLQGVEISHVAVYKWIKKYVNLMESYLDKITPQVGDKWRADEMYMKIKGNMKYLFAILDDETRYLIAQEVADSKFKHEVRSLFRQAKESMGKAPTVLITDGLHAYQDAFKKEFWSRHGQRKIHINTIKFHGDKTNNKMERVNGEIRDREKTMRGLKKNDTPVLRGYQIYHNYIRPHMALEGKTPADVSGIKIEGENKWITLIQNASEHRSK